MGILSNLKFITDLQACDVVLRSERDKAQTESDKAKALEVSSAELNRLCRAGAWHVSGTPDLN